MPRIGARHIRAFCIACQCVRQRAAVRAPAYIITSRINESRIANRASTHCPSQRVFYRASSIACPRIWRHAAVRRRIAHQRRAPASTIKVVHAHQRITHRE